VQAEERDAPRPFLNTLRPPSLQAAQGAGGVGGRRLPQARES